MWGRFQIGGKQRRSLEENRSIRLRRKHVLLHSRGLTVRRKRQSLWHNQCRQRQIPARQRFSSEAKWAAGYCLDPFNHSRVRRHSRWGEPHCQPDLRHNRQSVRHDSVWRRWETCQGVAGLCFRSHRREWRVDRGIAISMAGQSRASWAGRRAGRPQRDSHSAGSLSQSGQL
jgi:hypothetical protein